MNITVNGEPRDIDSPELLTALPELGDGMAVALNQTVVPRSQWETITLAPGDALDILIAVQGG